LIRQKIIDVCKQRGKPVDLAEASKELGISGEELKRQLDSSERLRDLSGLDPRQADELIRFYGDDLLFETDVVKNLRRYLETRGKLDRFEARAKKKRNDKPSEPDNE
jgi:hypothetical protein